MGLAQIHQKNGGRLKKHNGTLVLNNSVDHDEDGIDGVRSFLEVDLSSNIWT